MSVQHLPRIVPASGDEPEDIGAGHPMRTVTEDVAARGAWTPELAVNIANAFDQLAPGWHTRRGEQWDAALRDALDRGGPFADGLTLEIGSGVGTATPILVERFPRIVAMDLSMEMLRHAPSVPSRVRADGGRLPLSDRSVATAVLQNMLLFPDEIDRVLREDGALVWANTIGARTPIHLSAEQVDDALPGSWDVVASEAGWGTWCVARRSRE